jgi:hypothetical protein
MNIVEQLNGAADKVRHNVHTYRRSAAERARRGVSRAAKAMAAARTPVDTLAGAAQRLNDLTHDAVAKLVRQNAGSIEVLISGGAARLSELARTEDFRAFIREQAALNPAVRARVSRDLEQLWALATRTGRELGALATDTYAELLYGVPTRKATGNRKTTRRSTKRKVRTRKAH